MLIEKLCFESNARFYDRSSIQIFAEAVKSEALIPRSSHEYVSPSLPSAPASAEKGTRKLDRLFSFHANRALSTRRRRRSTSPQIHRLPLELRLPIPREVKVPNQRNRLHDTKTITSGIRVTIRLALRAHPTHPVCAAKIIDSNFSLDAAPCHVHRVFPVCSKFTLSGDRCFWK